MAIEPFAIALPQETLDDLQQRLRRTRWPDEVEDAGWDYGASLPAMRELVAYWRDAFDWRRQEAALNALPQVRVTVDGLGLHAVHARGAGPDPLPLVLLHGWPDCFLRFARIVPLLTDPAAHGADPRDSFDVVVPSLPGFGFSDRPRRRGCTHRRVAPLIVELMRELGYPRFGAHGGDVGAGVAEWIAFDHPDRLAGLHLTDIPLWHLFAIPPSDLSEDERLFLEHARRWGAQEGAYAALQSTKPQLPAVGLNDSPAGLATWLVAHFRAWSDCDGEVERRFSRDELLANATIYWATQTIGSSFRLYYERACNPFEPPAGRPPVPTGVATFPKEPAPAPRAYAERIFDLTHWTEMPRGGHFTAMEEPELLAQDLRDFFRPHRGGGPGSDH